MKKIELSQLLSILANLGVIAGLVFLAIEIQQNNFLLSEQARQSFNEYVAAENQILYLNPGGLTSLLLEANRGEDLTEEEAFRRYYDYWKPGFRDYIQKNVAVR